MCFGSSKPDPNPNIKPAPYALDQSHTAVQTEVTPSKKPLPSDVAASEVKPMGSSSASSGLNLKGM